MMFVKRSSVYLITASKKQFPTEGYGNQNTEEKAESSLCRAWIIPPDKKQMNLLFDVTILNLNRVYFLEK